jgi:hypothetical protein
MPKYLPTLGVTGWINDFAGTADYLLSCYIATEASDSVLHDEQNTSMQYTLKTKAGDMLGIEQQMVNDLATKFQAVYGNTAEAFVEVTADDPNKPDQFSISFTGVVYDELGRPYTVGKLVFIDEGRVVRIAKLNNG